mmetsp:Transcript_49308/g.142882  ORF Transcript_49308/g.142882 Transcript_49308/m.142882 type:complete len:260 (+) Transcript_49308:494-1273(+)
MSAAIARASPTFLTCFCCSVSRSFAPERASLASFSAVASSSKNSCASSGVMLSSLSSANLSRDAANCCIAASACATLATANCCCRPRRLPAMSCCVSASFAAASVSRPESVLKSASTDLRTCPDNLAVSEWALARRVLALAMALVALDIAVSMPVMASCAASPARFSAPVKNGNSASVTFLTSASACSTCSEACAARSLACCPSFCASIAAKALPTCSSPARSRPSSARSSSRSAPRATLSRPAIVSLSLTNLTFTTGA